MIGRDAHLAFGKGGLGDLKCLRAALQDAGHPGRQRALLDPGAHHLDLGRGLTDHARLVGTAVGAGPAPGALVDVQANAEA